MKRPVTQIVRAISFAFALLAIASCGEKKFHVQGEIKEAKDSMLYFENISLDGIKVIDSLKLSEEGSFKLCTKGAYRP